MWYLGHKHIKVQGEKKFGGGGKFQQNETPDPRLVYAVTLVDCTNRHASESGRRYYVLFRRRED
jgi:hypothetical protein